MKFVWMVMLCSLMTYGGAQAESEADKGSDNARTSDFQRWLEKTNKKLESKSTIIQTALGPVECVLMGKGPIVLSLHGGFGGWDQGILISSKLIKQGFSVLSVSRPGYLGTPLSPSSPSVEYTPAQQANLMAALLDALQIPKVAVLGFSAGAPVAYAFAQQFPNRTTAAILLSLGASPSEDFPLYGMLGGNLSLPVLPDYTTYLLNLSLSRDFYSMLKVALGADTTLTGEALDRRIRSTTKNGSSSQGHFLSHILKTAMPISPRLPGILNDFLGLNYWTTNFSPFGYTTPTLIVQAFNDSNGCYPTAQAVQAMLPNSKLITIEESGHLIWLGPQTSQWENKVAEFLKPDMRT